MFMSKGWIATLIALLVVVGALNWGYVAWSRNCDDDLVKAVVPPMFSRIIYALVGVAGLVVASAVVMNRGPAMGKKAYSMIKKRK